MPCSFSLRVYQSASTIKINVRKIAYITLFEIYRAIIRKIVMAVMLIIRIARKSTKLSLRENLTSRHFFGGSNLIKVMFISRSIYYFYAKTTVQKLRHCPCNLFEIVHTEFLIPISFIRSAFKSGSHKIQHF